MTLAVAGVSPRNPPVPLETPSSLPLHPSCIMSKIHRLPLAARRSDRVAAAEKATTDADLLQVGELASATGKTVRAIHHYENLGLLTPHKRSKGRYRLYAPDAVARVRWINKLHDMGMKLSEVQSILSSWEGAASAPEGMASMRAIYSDRLREVQAQIARLTALEHELRNSIAYFDTCDTCDPSELVAACSACTVHDRQQPEPELVAGLYACSAVATS